MWHPETDPVEYRRAFCSIGSLSGGPAGSYSGSGIGAGTTSGASVYAPTGQATADTQAQGLLTSLYDLNPGVLDLQKSYANNPYYNQALTGAQSGATYGADTAALAYPAAQSLYGGAQKVLDTAFDPQHALYNRGRQQTSDSANAINSMYGVGSSPYGAGLATDALRNYDIDWQGKQLDRQAEGLKSASLGDTSGLAQGYGASDIASSSAALPSQSYIKNLGDVYTGYSDASKYGTGLYNDLSSYLGTGQKASTISGALGSLGTSQKSSALSGLGGLATTGTNFLTGTGGISGLLGLDPSTGLLGSLFGTGMNSSDAALAGDLIYGF